MSGAVSMGSGGAGGIDPAIIDAKGDLIVGTANDAVDNLPVGSNGQALLADATQPMGVRWSSIGGLILGAATQFPDIGEWIIPSNYGAVQGASQVGVPGAGSFAPIDLPATMTFDRIGVSVASPASAAAYTYRLGVYPDDGTGQRPATASAPQFDAGTVDVASLGGERSITINQTLTAGRWWAAAVINYSSLTSHPNVLHCPGVPLLPTASIPGTTISRRWSATMGTGALPSSLTIAPDPGWIPIAIGLRRSA